VALEWVKENGKWILYLLRALRCSLEKLTGTKWTGDKGLSSKEDNGNECELRPANATV
jgi:hypothetical protein